MILEDVKKKLDLFLNNIGKDYASADSKIETLSNQVIKNSNNIGDITNLLTNNSSKLLSPINEIKENNLKTLIQTNLNKIAKIKQLQDDYWEEFQVFYKVISALLPPNTEIAHIDKNQLISFKFFFKEYKKITDNFDLKCKNIESNLTDKINQVDAKLYNTKNIIEHKLEDLKKLQNKLETKDFVDLQNQLVEKKKKMKAKKNNLQRISQK